MPTPDQVASPYRAAASLPIDRRYGGRITAYDQLPIHALGDQYVVDGNGTVTSLPSLSIGETVFLQMAGTPTFTNSARLICPNNQNYVATVGDFVIVRSNGDGIWRLYVLSTTSVASFNAFRNPGMDIDQRGTNANPLTVTTSGGYSVDGWIVVPTGASCTAQQVTGGAIAASSVHALQVTGAASVTDILVKQRIESSAAAPLAGRTITVQAKVYNNTGGSITPTLTVKHPTTTADTFGSLTTDVSAVSLQACANAATTTVAYSFTAAANTILGLEVTLDFGNNFSAAGKTLLITDCDICVTPGATAGAINSSPPPVELRPIGVEMPFNQRYFAQYNYVNGNAIAISMANTTTSTVSAFPFRTAMRAAPTGSVTGSAVAINAGGSSAGGTPSIVNRRSNLTPHRRPILTPLSGGVWR